MILFQKLTPMLQTHDMSYTIEWYQSVLGFDCVRREGDIWCHLKADHVELMFMNNEMLGPPLATATQYIHVNDVMALWEKIQDHVQAEWGPEKMPNGMLEFAIKDPNGYIISFGQVSQKDNAL